MSLELLKYDRSEDRRRLDALVGRLGDTLSAGSEVAGVVTDIIEDVRARGDEALLKYEHEFTNPNLTTGMIRVSPEEMEAAEKSLDGGLRDALARSIGHVREYQQAIMPVEPGVVMIDGAELGLRFAPMKRVGLYVPGGRAAYPSSLIMQAVPAQVAGVGELAVCCPPPTNMELLKKGDSAFGGDVSGGGGDISPLVLAVCNMLGITELYRTGGAVAIAAMAYGTDTIAAVDFIAGPGGAFSQQAKRQVFGRVGIDGLFGPSEVVILIDDTARAEWIAADIIAQAEHDPGCSFLVSESEAAIEAVRSEIEKQLPVRKRREAAEGALRDWSAAVLVNDEHDVIEVIDMIAAEHVTLAVAEPREMMAKLRHGGAWFLKDMTPVASGDYYAGPSHCLPTGTTARFSSGISVYTFLKRSSVESYPDGMPDKVIDDIVRLAEAEGLDGHAHSARVRRGG